MIGHILRKDLRFLWPLATAVALLQVITTVLLAGHGPFQRWSSSHGEYGWISNNLLPFLCLVGLVGLVLAVVHLDRLPGTSQDWLTRPIPRRTLVLAKLTFIVVAGLGPVFACDLATGLLEHLRPIDVVEASAARSVVLLALVALPGALLGAVTRNLADALVLGVITLVVIGVGLLVVAQLDLEPHVLGSGYGWVVTALLTIASCAAVPILVALQLRWRSTARLRWVTVAVLALAPIVFWVPWRAVVAVQRLFTPNETAGSVPAAVLAEQPPTIIWPSDDVRQSRGAKAIASLRVPLVLPADSAVEWSRFDHAFFRLENRAGRVIAESDQGYETGFAEDLTQPGRRTDPQITADFPAAVAERAIAQHATLVVRLQLTRFRLLLRAPLASLNGRRLDPASYCRRTALGDAAYLQCTSTRQIDACLGTGHRLGRGDLRVASIRNCGKADYAPWPVAFWRDAYYTAEFEIPPDVKRSDADDDEDPVIAEARRDEATLSTFAVVTHVAQTLSVPLDRFTSGRTVPPVLSRDGMGPGARFSQPSGLVVDRRGGIYLVDRADSIVRRIAQNGEVTTVAGVAGECGKANGRGAEARFCKPSGITIDAADNLYVVDAGNALIRKVAPTGEVTTIAAIVDAPGKAHADKWLEQASYPARAPDGSVYVFGRSRDGAIYVSRIAPDGHVTTVAGPGEP